MARSLNSVVHSVDQNPWSDVKATKLYMFANFIAYLLPFRINSLSTEWSNMTAAISCAKDMLFAFARQLNYRKTHNAVAFQIKYVQNEFEIERKRRPNIVRPFMDSWASVWRVSFVPKMQNSELVAILVLGISLQDWASWVETINMIK